MKKNSAILICLVFVFSAVSFGTSAQSSQFSTRVLNFEAAIGLVNSNMQKAQSVSQATKNEFDAKVKSEIAWLESKRQEYSSAETSQAAAAIQQEVYARMPVISKELKIMLAQVGFEGIDNVISTAQQMINKSSGVVSYFEKYQCSRTEELSVLIPQMQQSLDSAKQSQVAAKAKLNELTPDMSVSEANQIIQEARKLSQNTVKSLKEVQRIGNQFNSLSSQIGLELQDKFDGKDTEC